MSRYERIEEEEEEEEEEEGSDDTVVYYGKRSSRGRRKFRDSMELEKELNIGKGVVLTWDEEEGDEDNYNDYDNKEDKEIEYIEMNNYVGVEKYALQYVYSDIANKEEIRRINESFKFDMINDELLKRGDGNYDIKEIINEYSISISKTPYKVLLHSIKPKIIAFSILSYIRGHIIENKLSNGSIRREIIQLIIISILILNAVQNASIGLQIYMNIFVERSRLMVKSIRRLEGIYEKYGDSKRIVKISEQFLVECIMMRVKRIRRWSNNAVLKTYLSLYDVKEIDQETMRLCEVKRFLLCVLMSLSIDNNNNNNTNMNTATLLWMASEEICQILRLVQIVERELFFIAYR